MKNDVLNILDASVFPQFLNWQIANTKRFREVFTLVFIDSPNHSQVVKDLLLEQMRGSDMVFRFPENEPDIILMDNTGEEEAVVFVKRLAALPEVEQYHIAASIMEIKNGDALVEDILQTGLAALEKALELPACKPYITDRTFVEFETQCVRVSIIDEDPLVTMVLQKLIDHLGIEQVELDVRVFHDGQEFLESNWYMSSNTHLVIVNDILPKKNGLDILYALRELPNTQKFHIFMLTKRHSEMEMIFAYENGVDEYMTKPFNPRLFEAQIKKVLNRIYYE